MHALTFPFLSVRRERLQPSDVNTWALALCILAVVAGTPQGIYDACRMALELLDRLQAKQCALGAKLEAAGEDWVNAKEQQHKYSLKKVYDSTWEELKQVDSGLTNLLHQLFSLGDHRQ